VGFEPPTFLHPDPRLKKPSVSYVASSSECFLEGWQTPSLLKALFNLDKLLFFHDGVQNRGLKLASLFLFGDFFFLGGGGSGI